MHKASTYIVRQLNSAQIDTLIIDHNEGWKQDANRSRVCNQSFCQIPFTKFFDELEYKCRRNGIRVIRHEEGHTSKCSFADDEEICHHDQYAGRRVKRSLFRQTDGSYVHADLNASFNIMKKTFLEEDEWTNERYLECMSKMKSTGI